MFVPSGVGVEQITKGRRRFYRVVGDDRVLPTAELTSVTTALGVIAKPALVGWAAKVTREAAVLYLRNYLGETVTEGMVEDVIAECDGARNGDAAEIGTRVHAAIEANTPPGPGPEALCYRAWTEWMADTGARILATETPVYHPGRLYAGTVDAVIEIDGSLAILDYKTSGALYDEYALQLAAYASAIAALGHPTPRAFALRLPKVYERYEFREVDVGVAWPQFDLALRLHSQLGGRGLWR